MAIYVVYGSAGEILRTVETPEGNSEAQLTGRAVGVIPAFIGVQDTTHFVANSEVTAKQPFNLQMTNTEITADGVDECVITNIPAGATVEWPDGQSDEVTDGEVGFSVDLPGTYALVFDAVPYLREEVTIEAVAAA